MSLLGLYSNNECPCRDNPPCLKDLNSTIVKFMRNVKPCLSEVKEVLYLMKGSQKSMNIVKVIPSLLKFIILHDISKETLDCYLEVFTVVYLKAEEVFKRAVLYDLQ